MEVIQVDGHIVFKTTDQPRYYVVANVTIADDADDITTKDVDVTNHHLQWKVRTFSDLTPISPCGYGTYASSPNDRNRLCIQCEDGTSTMKLGSTSSSDCKGNRYGVKTIGQRNINFN